MVAPVVLITTGVLMANGILATYTTINDRIRSLKRERLDTPDGEKLEEIDRQASRSTRGCKAHVACLSAANRRWP